MPFPDTYKQKRIEFENRKHLIDDQPKHLFAFNKMHENCFCMLDQNYNCALGLKNIIIQNFLLTYCQE